jgi:glycosyltransferase involved in cell wall biosynthesis
MKHHPTVEVFTFTYNESLYIDYLVKWYSARFKNLTITVYDNHSTDDTVVKARALGCNVVSWGDVEFTQEQLTEIKNSCFKNSGADYFLICDVDELLDVSDLDLLAKEPSTIQGIGYQMIGNSEMEFSLIRLGARDTMYDKYFLFKKSDLLEINYDIGAHSCKPIFAEAGKRKKHLRRELYHFRWLSLDHVLNRYLRNAKRTSPSDRAKGYGFQYFLDEKNLKEEYDLLKRSATELAIDWNPLVREPTEITLTIQFHFMLRNLACLSKGFYTQTKGLCMKKILGIRRKIATRV